VASELEMGLALDKSSGHGLRESQIVLGILTANSVKVTDLFHQEYLGSRYSFG
jgi:hypothetical protein